MPRLRLIVVTTLFLVAHSMAAVIGTTGQVVEINPTPRPIDLRINEWESDSEIRLVAERKRFALPWPLDLDFVMPGEIRTQADLSPGEIVRTTRIDSYILHFDPVGTLPSNTPKRATGSVTFDRDILGISVLGESLLQSSIVIGTFGTIIRDDGALLNGLELGGLTDVVKLSPDRRTLEVDLFVGPNSDDIRIITLTSPSIIPAPPVPFHTNLLVNGDAESGEGASSFVQVSPPTSWLTTGSMTAVKYLTGGLNLDYLNLGDSSAYNGGDSYFAGGPGSAVSTAKQVIDLSDLSEFIDDSMIKGTLEGYLGGKLLELDGVEILAKFLDASNQVLGVLSIGPVTPDDRFDATSLRRQTAVGALPRFTRSVEVEIVASRFGSGYNDGYADNISFSVAVVPELDSFSLLGAIVILGAGWIWSAKRRSPLGS